MNTSSNPFASQLAAQFLASLPVWIVYLAGIVLAFVFWSRSRLPCALALAASVLLLLTSIGSMGARAWIMHRHESQGWSADELSTAFSVVSLLASVAHALGLAMLVTAVFVRRGARAPVAA